METSPLICSIDYERIKISLERKRIAPHKKNIVFISDFNPLSTNPTKWSNTLKHFVG